MLKKKSRLEAMVLPSLILVTFILVLLSTAVLTQGTSSLRSATQGEQTDQAIYTAESAISMTVENYISNEADFKDSKTIKLGEDSADNALAKVALKGELEEIQASYKVWAFVNEKSTAQALPKDFNGPKIPPNMLYILAEGTSSNQIKQRAGALFRIRMDAFEAGIVTDYLEAKNSKFKAYDSQLNKDPSLSSDGNTAIMANRKPRSGEKKQFHLDNTLVDGAIFAYPGSILEEAITKTDNRSKVSRESILADPIATDSTEIAIPTNIPLGTSKGDPGGALGSTGFDASRFPIKNMASTDLTISYNEAAQTFSFKDEGAGLSTSVLATSDIFKNGGTVNINSDGKQRTVTIAVADGEMAISYSDYAVGSGTQMTGTNEVTFDASAFSPISSPLNPTELAPGEYGTVKIEAGHTASLELGRYVIENLEIEEGGTLKLPQNPASGGDSEAKIWIKDQLVVQGENAIVNDTQNPPGLQMYYNGTSEIKLSGGASSYLTMVAPNSKVSLVGLDPEHPTNFYGALLGSQVYVENANFYFDQKAKKVGTGEDGEPITLINRHRL